MVLSSGCGRLLCLLALLSSPWTAACGSSGPQQEIPAATLGATIESEETLRPLLRRWMLGTTAERQALDPQLSRFSKRYAGDDLVRLALVLRAFNALERGQLERAKELASGAEDDPQGSPLLGAAGTTRDLATLVVGAAERRRGEHDRALTRLMPLLHKMLDGFATALLDEELVHGAVGAKRWAAAVFFMGVWQREVEPDRRQAVEAQIRKLVAEVPTGELLSSLHERTLRAPIEEADDMSQLLTQQLAVRAVADRDHPLARILLERYGVLLGDYGEAVAQLAVDTSRARVLGRTVGVLVSTRSLELSRRSADLVSGMAFGLGLPGSEARLVTRTASDEADDVRRALSDLAAEGAAVVVGGLDLAHVDAAVAHANESALPILLLSELSEVAASPFVFVVGESPSRTSGLLAARLRGDGASALAGLGVPGGAGSVPVVAEHSCNELPTVAELRGAQADAVLIYDGSYCEEELAPLLKTLQWPLGAGLGVSVVDVPARSVVLAAGIFPVVEDKPDPRLDAWNRAGRGPPSWWHALGHDAALLAWRAVEGLEEATSEGDDDQVRARRVQAASALASAEAQLWTSNARGFSGRQRLSRQIQVKRWR